MTHAQLVTSGIQKAKDCHASGMKAAEIVVNLQASYASITTPVIRAIVSYAVNNSRIRSVKKDV